MHSEGCRADKHTFDSKLLFSKVLFSFLVSGYWVVGSGSWLLSPFGR